MQEEGANLTVNQRKVLRLMFGNSHTVSMNPLLPKFDVTGTELTVVVEVASDISETALRSL